MKRFRNAFLSALGTALFPLIFLFPGSGALFAEAPLELGNTETYNLSSHALIFKDVKKRFTIRDVSSPEFASRFRKIDNKKMSFGSLPYPLWFRLHLKNNTDRRWSVLLDSPTLDSIEIFEKNDSGKFESYRTGDTLRYSGRKVDSISFFLPLMIRKGEQKTIYIRVESKGPLLIPMTLNSEKAVRAVIAGRNLYYGMYYGILIIVMLANLLIFFAIKNIEYFYYVLYLVATIFAQMFMDGLSSKYIWAENPEWSFLGATTVLIMDTTIIAFSRQFLALKVFSRRADRALLFFLWTALALTIAGPFMPYALAVRIAIVLTILMCLVVIIASVYSVVKGNRTSYYFIFAWTLLLIGMVSRALTYSGALPKNLFTFYFMAIGSIVEVILLSLALIDRIYQMRREKEKAQRDLIAAQKESLEVQAAMNRAFTKFVPMQFLQYLQKDKIEDVKLGDAVEEEMSVLFCDIRSFAQISEKMSPAENFKFLNTFYKKIGPVIRKHGGFIDKYIGDAIMALFPSGADDAVRAGVSIQKMVNRINKARIRMKFPPVAVGVGIHTGNLILGTIGEAERMESTVISDAVNLASRIEGLTKSYGAKILISETTLEKLHRPEDFCYRKLNRVRIKGKEDVVTIVEIFNADDENLIARKKEHLPLFSEGIEALLAGNYAQAQEKLREILHKTPEDDVVGNIVRLLDKKTDPA